jgi:hypothetical protein
VNRRRPTAACVALVAVAALLAACGVQTDDDARVVSPDAIPSQLREQPETVTTPTTAPSSPITRTESYYLVKRESADSANWTLEPQTTSFELTPAERGEIPRLLLEALIGARSNEALRLSNDVPPDLEILGIELRADEGVLDVDLDGLDAVAGGALTRLMAQIVFTLTGMQSYLTNVTGVRFFDDGASTGAQTPAGEVPADRPVTRDDFPQLRDQFDGNVGENAE